MLENRRHLRIREIFDIRWAILGTELTGEGKVLNVSTSGFQLQLDGKFDPRRSGLLYIDGHDEKPLDFGSKRCKIVWLRRLENKTGFVCGVEFLKNTPRDKALDDWISRKTEDLAQTTNANILINYIA